MRQTAEERAVVEATAKVTKADGTVQSYSGTELAKEVGFRPFGCLCGGVWLMIKETNPTCCPYCGQEVLVQGE